MEGLKKVKKLFAETWETLVDIWQSFDEMIDEVTKEYHDKRAIEKEENKIARKKSAEIHTYLMGKRVRLPNDKLLDDDLKRLHLSEQGELYISNINRYSGPYTIVDSEFIHDISQVNEKGGWVGRTIAGGLIAGPAGAVIGAVTRKTKTKMTDNSVLFLRIEDSEGEEEVVAVACTSSQYVKWKQIL